MTDAFFQTPAVVVAPVAATAGTDPVNTHALGVLTGALPVAQDLGGGTDTSSVGGVRGEAHPPAGPVLEIHVVGLPAPQGSKKGFVVGGRAIVVDDNKPKLRSWRQDVKQAALDATRLAATSNMWQPLTGPLELDITFLMPRPRGHWRTGRNAHLLRDGAPIRPATKPDVDKLLRATLDALTGVIYRDDAQVVGLTGRKHYTTGHTGALIAIYTDQHLSASPTATSPGR